MFRAAIAGVVILAGLVPRLRRTARVNLRIAFGPSGPGLYMRTLTRLAENVSAVVRACRRNPNRRPVIRFDVDRYRSIVQEPPPYVCVTGHFGPFELWSLVQDAMNTKLDVVVRTPKKWLSRRALSFVRGRLGTNVIDKKNVMRETIRSLSEGRSVALLADHNAGYHGVFVPFLGFPASTTRLPAMLARKFNRPILMGFIRREGNEYVAWIERAIRPDPSAQDDADERRMLTEMNAVFSDVIRKYPEEWFWFHRRWKTRPGDMEAHILR